MRGSVRQFHYGTLKRPDKGRQQRRYPLDQMNTPYEKLKALPGAKRFLKPELTFKALNLQACAMADNQAAEQLNQERAKLFKRIQYGKAA